MRSFSILPRVERGIVITMETTLNEFIVWLANFIDEIREYEND